MLKRHITFLTATVLAALTFANTSLAQTKAPGLAITFASDKGGDLSVVSNAMFYVPTGQAPTPFLPVGKFTATVNGFIAVDLRGDYAFQANFNGSLKVEVNGQTLIDAATNGIVESAKALRLGKGATNVLAITFTSPASGDAFLQLHWKPSDSFFHPIPAANLSHTVSEKESLAEKVRLGRELFIENRCAKCHAGPKPENGIPELAMDAPSFEQIGTRRNHDWMARWILDPKSLRASSHMPKVLHGEKARENAEAVAAYLSSLKPADFKPGAVASSKEKAEAGKKLFEALHCVACHNAPDSTENDATKIALKQVAAKFVAGTLTEFLKKPNAHYAWIHMPNFNLNDEQREQLAGYLLVNSESVATTTASTDKAVLEKGQQIVQTSGCLNCHTLKLDNQFKAKSLAEIADWKKGCLAEAPGDKAPNFNLTSEERQAVQAFAVTDRLSLERNVSSDFATRYARILNCRNCHGQFEGFPNFEILGGKLKPEYMTKLIAGEHPQKPRPWLESQMPGFPKFAEVMAKGLAAQHGFAPQTPAEPSIDEAMAKVGHNLVSNPPLGFACISCHSVGSVGALQVFEAPGINLAFSGERLQSAFFHRWVRNPPIVDPTTKMPVYFDEQGKSPIAEVYDGDGVKQIEALRQYIRHGDKMAAPKTE